MELPALSEGFTRWRWTAKRPGHADVYPAELIVEFVDVGQGDAVIIRAPSGEAYLVDTGPSGSAEVLRQRLRHHQIERLEQVILTHTDADHIGGLAELLEGPDGLIGSADDLVVGALVEDGSLSERTTQTARTLHALTIDRLPRRVAQAGDAITLPGGFRLTTVERRRRHRHAAGEPGGASARQRSLGDADRLLRRLVRVAWRGPDRWRTQHARR